MKTFRYHISNYIYCSTSHIRIHRRIRTTGNILTPATLLLIIRQRSIQRIILFLRRKRLRRITTTTLVSRTRIPRCRLRSLRSLRSLRPLPAAIPRLRRQADLPRRPTIREQILSALFRDDLLAVSRARAHPLGGLIQTHDLVRRLDPSRQLAVCGQSVGQLRVVRGLGPGDFFGVHTLVADGCVGVLRDAYARRMVHSRRIRVDRLAWLELSAHGGRRAA